MNEIQKSLTESIFKIIRERDTFTILTHKKPDGDTIGCAIALKNIILDNFPSKSVKISGDTYPAFLKFLENNDEVSDEYFNTSQVIVVDTSSKERVWDNRLITNESIKIDHHHEVEDWLIGLGGDRWPACGQLLIEMVKHLNLKLSYKSKEALYVSVYTDTSGFTQRITDIDETMSAIDFLGLSKTQQQNIVSKMEPTLEQKAHIQKLKQQLVIEEGVGFLYTSDVVTNDYYRNLVDTLFNIEDVNSLVVGFADQIPNRVSIRTKSDFDISTIAREYKGNGHKSSAGAESTNQKEFMQIVSKVKTLTSSPIHKQLKI